MESNGGGVGSEVKTAPIILGSPAAGTTVPLVTEAIISIGSFLSRWLVYGYAHRAQQGANLCPVSRSRSKNTSQL
jgi:hypothetical protein